MHEKFCKSLYHLGFCSAVVNGVEAQCHGLYKKL